MDNDCDAAADQGRQHVRRRAMLEVLIIGLGDHFRIAHQHVALHIGIGVFVNRNRSGRMRHKDQAGALLEAFAFDASAVGPP